MTVRGHGILLNCTLNINHGSGSVVERVIMNGAGIRVYQSASVSITNTRILTSGQWGDGNDVYSSSQVTIKGAFIRSGDDCIALYAHRWEFYGDTRDVLVSGCSLWADVAHPINIATHGDSDEPEVLENIRIENIDILDHREPQMDYQGCIAINPGDSNLVRNIRISDLRVEDFRWGQLINFRVKYNPKYNTSIGRGIEDVYVKNLSYQGSRALPSMILGYDGERLIKNVTFENLVLNGTVIADSMKKPGWYLTTDMAQWQVNEHVKDLRFLTTEEA